MQSLSPALSLSPSFCVSLSRMLILVERKCSQQIAMNFLLRTRKIRVVISTSDSSRSLSDLSSSCKEEIYLINVNTINRAHTSEQSYPWPFEVSPRQRGRRREGESYNEINRTHAAIIALGISLYKWSESKHSLSGVQKATSVWRFR